MAEKKIDELLEKAKKGTLAAAARRARHKREQDAWVEVLLNLTDELRDIADNGQFISEVNIRIRFDGGVISDSKVKAEGRKPKATS